ncbi:DoxX family membrane protein [Aristophania vespae]|uniref:DoxX family membrane protein n=1 Tax=Aristophania vespae TaxID=2697033 RepID=A0A6P1NHL0_9PROT|nr:DoxX family protein [Aristophania vespae]QHI95142.1 DoxX family membrane protein [Aristophania vespae]
MEWRRGALPDWSKWTASALMFVALFFNGFIMSRALRPGYLISMLCFVTAWRVAAMNDVTLLEQVCFVTFLVMIMQFVEIVICHWKKNGIFGFIEALMWQLAVTRIYFGMNEIGHATEKVFAGQVSYENLVHIFTVLGTPMPGIAVISGGVIEFALAFGVGCGFLTRLSAMGGIIYFLVATVGFGGEWMHGYSWVGGGWEYIALLIVFYGSLFFTGAGQFSLDAWLIERGFMPKMLLRFCCPQSAVKHFVRKLPNNCVKNME